MKVTNNTTDFGSGTATENPNLNSLYSMEMIATAIMKKNLVPSHTILDML